MSTNQVVIKEQILRRRNNLVDKVSTNQLHLKEQLLRRGSSLVETVSSNPLIKKRTKKAVHREKVYHKHSRDELFRSESLQSLADSLESLPDIESENIKEQITGTQMIDKCPNPPVSTQKKKYYFSDLSLISRSRKYRKSVKSKKARHSEEQEQKQKTSKKSWLKTVKKEITSVTWNNKKGKKKTKKYNDGISLSSTLTDDDTFSCSNKGLTPSLLDENNDGNGIESFETNETFETEDLSTSQIPDEVSWSDGGEVVASCIYSAANFVAQRLMSSVDNHNACLATKRLTYEENNNQSSAEKDLEQKETIDDDFVICIEIIQEDLADEIEVELGYLGDEKPIIEELQAYTSHLEKLLLCTSDAKSVAADLRANSEAFTASFRDNVSHTVIDLLDSVTQADIMGKIVKDKESREVLSAAGNIALAGFGASAVIFEAIRKTIDKAAEKRRKETVRQVNRKFGTYAGKLIDDTGKAVHDTVQSLYTLRLLSDGVVVNYLVRGVGKAHMKRSTSGV